MIDRSIATTATLLAMGLVPGLSSFREGGPGRAEAERIDRGYYEKIVQPEDRANLQRVKPAPFDSGRLCNNVADLREYVLKPNLRTSHRGASWTTNAHGMRDREYAEAKPGGVERIALVGDSIGSGWGVDDGLGFEPLAEAALDARSRDRGGDGVEILNFSVPGHAPGQRWEHFRREGWGFRPGVVIFEATPADLGWDERRLRGLLARGIGREAPQYREALASAGVEPGGTFESYKAALKDHRRAILENVYKAAAGECRSHGAASVWVLIPRVGKPIAPGDRDLLIASARQAGFETLVDLSDAFDGIAPEDLAVAPNDFHPNARGHALLAKRLGRALEARAGGPATVRAPR